MKTTILTFAILSFVAIFFWACDKKKAQDTQTGNEEPTTEKPTPKPEEVPQEEVYQVAGFQKTACFGQCPVYQVKFYSDGKAVWEGKRFVEKEGMYEANVGKDKIKEIKAKAFEADFLGLYNEYPRENKVVDLPTTITYLRVGDQVKTIRNTHGAPKELKIYEKYLEELIESIPWKKSQPKD